MIDSTGVNARKTSIGISVVSPERAYYPVRYHGNSEARWIYTVAVPIGVPVQLFLDSSLNILDQSGKAVPKRQSSLTTQAADSTGATVNWSVQPAAQTTAQGNR